ncbi:Gfo/Idh/MocA family protein [Massilia niastensis]|uniref:Gfo/Idh/MocA family protein n=1 Tax=Massilia niastensis TaxID=544911 RepID=UPI00036DCC27|nr:Gfo/Idh/MocA family oxidoreductase [Massilia niastensis]
MTKQCIRVGIIGTGGWARYGHIPVLQALDGFKVVALAGRNKDKVQKYADEFGIDMAFGSAEELIAHPEIDLVVVLAPTSEHGRLSAAVIAAGKDVYSEWPLSTSTAESEHILAQAKTKGVKHVIGLQRRFSPAVRYLKDLMQENYVGRLRAVRMSVGVDAFGPVMPKAVEWVLNDANFTHLLSIYGGHFHDVLFSTVGFPERLSAVAKVQFPMTTLAETGEQVLYASANEVMVIGTLADSALFSVQLEGGQAHRTGLQIDIMGTDGVLRVTNPHAFQNEADHKIEGMKSGAAAFAELPVPAEYAYLPVSDMDASAQDVAYLYSTYAKDKAKGTDEVTSFEDAVRQHHLIDQINASSAAFFAAGDAS